MINQYLGIFVFLYPILMSAAWVIGGLYFWFLYERKENDKTLKPKIKPPVTILVPCYNESKIIETTCRHLQYVNYPNYKVLFINDSSDDNTAEIIDKYVHKVPNFRQMILDKNSGKANALNTAIGFVDTPLILVLDADTILDKDALNRLVMPFDDNSDMGAVTGNVLVRNKNSILTKLQAAEFTCIIGLIKRCQQILGSLFTVSGCATMFSTEALLKVGGFSAMTATEDVDITWRLQKKFYKVIFEPKAKVFIQVPINIKGYIRQRKRWATGGWHLLKQHTDVFKESKLKKLWIVYMEFAISYIWAFCFVFLTLWNLFRAQSHELLEIELYLGWAGAVVSFIFIIQALVALVVNFRYDKSLKKCFLWICWYPIVFFVVGIVLIIWTAVDGLFKPAGTSGKWNSPTRDENQTFDVI